MFVLRRGEEGGGEETGRERGEERGRRGGERRGGEEGRGRGEKSVALRYAEMGVHSLPNHVMSSSKEPFKVVKSNEDSDGQANSTPQ